MHEDPCLEQNTGNRRIFWTTQPTACGVYNICGMDCAIPGLEYEKIEDPVEDNYKTIKNTEWLQSLILNILNTRARNAVRCPSPAAVYGHWSESYRDDDLYIGSAMWNAAEKSYVRTADAIKAINVAVQSDMGKLIAMGLATTVEVNTTYMGNNSVEVIVTVFTTTGRSVINLSGSFVSETWVWH